MKTIIVRSEDPKRPTKEELAKANQFAKDFAQRKQLVIGQDAHVGSQLPKFIDASTGRQLTSPAVTQFPSNIVTDIRKIPTYVTQADFVKGKDGLNYYQDQNGDYIPVHPDILRSSRFNPNRGTYGGLLATSTNVNPLIASR